MGGWIKLVAIVHIGLINTHGSAADWFIDDSIGLAIDVAGNRDIF